MGIKSKILAVIWVSNDKTSKKLASTQRLVDMWVKSIRRVRP
jgi:hypothetical protein